jgi:methylthioribose-1-phosphate isomerase
MIIGGKHYRSIWIKEDDPGVICVIDQRRLPFEFAVMELRSSEDAYHAISDMVVRGAPLIGVTAGFGIYLAALGSGEEGWCDEVHRAGERLLSSRPTAVNLRYAVERMLGEVDCAGSREGMIDRLFHLAVRLAEDEVKHCKMIGEHGLKIIRELYKTKGERVNILTHCNAGWLACVDYGTATAPIYAAYDAGIPLHVWVDETRPRMQGSRLTAYELGGHGVPHTVLVDNAGGHLMQRGEVDVVLVGSDRTTRKGDVANKIGTYLKALAAADNGIPFYVALPSSSIDFEMTDRREIKIEERDSREVTHIAGWDEEKGEAQEIMVVPEGSQVSNPGFDVTPGRLVAGLITEHGICEASEKGIAGLFQISSD